SLSSTVPPMHIMITGIEKMLPRTLDLDLALRLLPVNGTGQRATSYVSMITAPAPTGSGPQRLHVVFLDNGRRKLAARPDAIALACIRCGACLNVCPLFRRVGGHGYGSVYPGPIGILTAPFLLDGAESHEPGESLSDACSLCEACGEICPVVIPLPDLIRQARSEKAAKSSWLERSFWRSFGRLTAHPRLFRIMGCLGRKIPGAFLRGATPAWSQARSLPRQSASSFRSLLAERKRP
nr:lactate utilization protein [bacterium]